MTYSIHKTTTLKMDNFNIYVNVDAIRSELGKKIADSNPTRTFTSPSPQLTGTKLHYQYHHYLFLSTVYMLLIDVSHDKWTKKE